MSNLYDNMRKRQAKGISRSKKKSTISSKIYSQMKAGKGPFAKKEDKS